MSTETFARVRCERCPATYFRPEGVSLADLDGDDKPLDVGARIDLAYTEKTTNLEINLELNDLCPTCRVEIQGAIAFIKTRKEPGTWTEEVTEPVIVDVVGHASHTYNEMSYISSDPRQAASFSLVPDGAARAAERAAAGSPVRPSTEAATPTTKRSRRSMQEIAQDEIQERIDAEEAGSEAQTQWRATLAYMNDLTTKEKKADFARIFKDKRKAGDGDRPHHLPGDEAAWQYIRDMLLKSPSADSDATPADDTLNTDNPPSTGDATTTPAPDEDGFF